MDILLQGTFSSESKKYKDKIKSIYGNVFKLDFYPNKVYNKLIDCKKFRGVKYDASHIHSDYYTVFYNRYSIFGNNFSKLRICIYN